MERKKRLHREGSRSKGRTGRIPDDRRRRRRRDIHRLRDHRSEDRDEPSSQAPLEPEAPGDAVIRGLDEISIDLAEVVRLIHSTTVATNTTSRNGRCHGSHRERRTPRHARDPARTKPEPEVFNTRWTSPSPSFREDARSTSTSASTRRGVVLALDMDELALAVEQLVAQRVDAIAVCFLFSYSTTGTNARRGSSSRSGIRSWSLDLGPHPAAVARYERAVTTVADAYVKPAMKTYLGALQRTLATSATAGISSYAVERRHHTAAGLRNGPSRRFCPARRVLSRPRARREVAIENLIVIDVSAPASTHRS